MSTRRRAPARRRVVRRAPARRARAPAPRKHYPFVPQEYSAEDYQSPADVARIEAAEAARQKRNASSGLFKSIGSGIGSVVAGPMGSAFGGKAGQLLADIVGFGDYHVNGNSLMTGGLSPPQIVNSVNRGGFIIRHREYLGDLLSQTAFTVSQFPINPGVNSTFPWLSQVAVAFEEYEMRGIIFEFKSLSSDAVLSTGANSALGYVAMATQYNSASAPFQDKKALENYEFANSNKPSCSFYHPIECKRRLNVDTHLYVRTGSVPTGQDQRLYDLGELNVAVGGMQAASAVVGELWCTYEVELFHPKFVLDAGVLTDHFIGTTWANATPLGVSVGPVSQLGSNLGCIVNPTGIIWPYNISDGQYMVTLGWHGTGAVAAGYPALTGVNCTVAQYWLGDTTTAFNSPTTGVSTLFMSMNFVVIITGLSASLTFGAAGTLPTTPQTLDLWICELAEVQH